MEFSFTIDTKEYFVPEVITVELFERAMVWDIEDEKNHIPFVSVITECPLNELKLLDKETFNLIFAYCVTKLDFSDTELRHNIGGYQLIRLNECNFGQFVDIDILIADGMTKHAVELTCKLYGIPERAAAQKDVRDVWKALTLAVEWRQEVYREHNEFFEINESEDSDGVEMTINNLQLMWYNAILVLAEQKFLNIEPVTERPYKEALNFLTWKKNEMSKAQLEQLKRKNDLQRRTR